MARHTDVGNMSIYAGPNIGNFGVPASDLDCGCLRDGVGNGGGEETTKGKKHAEGLHLEGWASDLDRVK